VRTCPNCGRRYVTVSWKLGRHRALWIALPVDEARRLAREGLVRMLDR
jgi:hypothetical protein